MISGYDYDYDYIYIYIYIYIYRYVRKAQSGAYMWWKGLNSVKTGSKRAKNTCLSIPNGPGSLLEKRGFDPFLTHFLVPKQPHFKVFWDVPRAKTRRHRLKVG